MLRGALDASQVHPVSSIPRRHSPIDSLAELLRARSGWGLTGSGKLATLPGSADDRRVLKAGAH